LPPVRRAGGGAIATATAPAPAPAPATDYPAALSIFSHSVTTTTPVNLPISIANSTAWPLPLGLRPRLGLGPCPSPSRSPCPHPHLLLTRHPPRSRPRTRIATSGPPRRLPPGISPPTYRTRSWAPDPDRGQRLEVYHRGRGPGRSGCPPRGGIRPGRCPDLSSPSPTAEDRRRSRQRGVGRRRRA
jgi:hypothetical protein